MPTAIEHFSRIRVENTTLQVMADARRDLARLIREEESVVRHFVQAGNWPHKWVNMFVLEDLQPLAAQIKNANALSSFVADDIDRRPMVNVYDAADLSECAIFVNRGALKQDGIWRDALALRGLLAHEHGHPLAENPTVHAARALGVEVATENRPANAAIDAILHLLADRLCVHAPQEVFANEVAVRAGFGDALFHLDQGAIEKAKLGVSKRPALVQGLDKQVKEGKLDAGQAAALLLVGDLQAHLPFVLETTPFLRAGERHQAQVLEAALSEGIWPHLDPLAMRLYENLRDHYRELQPAWTAAEMKAWAETALAFLAEALRERNLQVRFTLVAARTNTKPQRALRPVPAASRNSTLHCNGGLP